MKANKETGTGNDDVTLTGTVIEKVFGAGSKSEHNAVYLQTADGDYPLRRAGGNPFSDPELTRLIGEKVTATGRLAQNLFVASSIAICDA